MTEVVTITSEKIPFNKDYKVKKGNFSKNGRIFWFFNENNVQVFETESNKLISFIKLNTEVFLLYKIRRV